MNIEQNKTESEQSEIISEYAVCVRWNKSPRGMLALRTAGKMPVHHCNKRRIQYYLRDIESLEQKHPEFLT